jgi:hypothetical protein
VSRDAVYQSVDDPNDLTVWHDFETLEAAQEFASSLRLREAMASAGVATRNEARPSGCLRLGRPGNRIF